MGMKADERACPKCAEIIKKAATLCKHCGVEVTPLIAAKKEATPGETALGCGLLLALVLGVATCVGSSDTSSSSSSESSESTAEDRRKGFHCLSAWDGSQRDVVAQVKAGLRDPNSFEHAETKITPVNEKGYHAVIMTYRARNGFGGMNAGRAIASVRQSDCAAENVITDN